MTDNRNRDGDGAPGRERARISVVVVSYNAREHLDELFWSLAAQSRRAEEVILVDNASSDGSAEHVRRAYLWARVLALEENTGFAEGNNRGLAAASGDYVALLNPDAAAHPDWLAELERALEADPSVGAAVSKIHLGRSDPPILDSAGSEFDNLGFNWGRGMSQPDAGQFDEPGEIPAVSACALLLRRAALGGEPLFDPELFMYYEEFDLTLRLRAAGFRIRYVPTAVVDHFRGQAVKSAARSPVLFQQYYANRNRAKLLAKHYPARVLLKSLPLILASFAYWDGYFLLHGGPGLMARAARDQVRFALRGLRQRRSGAHRHADRWLPWMAWHGLGGVLAVRRSIGPYEAGERTGGHGPAAPARGSTGSP